ncbi:MAG: protein-(glutamine-N5) methyltransferase, release factor-specific, partial [Parcubacteria group bacterium]|nr:protein-(glutamine-N5) methyltransferase, release factor-specific [Parcubacteria group bacterium]
WIPFLGLEIGLASKPLIPRPETEWWTELLVEHLLERFGDAPFTFLDLCAGSGAIGLAVLSKLPNAYVTFSELVPAHAELIEANIERNELDPGRSGVCIGNLFYPLEDRRFDVIASNPPYVPSERVLDASVVLFEPKEALVSGEDGLNVIRKIAASVPVHLAKEGELWLEADIDNIKEAQRLLIEGGAKRTVIRTDLYGRERLVLAFY